MSNPRDAQLGPPSPAFYKAGAHLTHTASLMLGGIHVSGQENLPVSSDPYILSPNHRSVADPLILGTAFMKITGNSVHALAGSHLWEADIIVAGRRILPTGKVLGKLMELTGAIPLARNKNFSQDVNEQIDRVVAGRGVLGIFPEGGVRHGATVAPIKRGIGLLAAQYGLPIMPVGIAGSELKPEEGRRDFGSFHVYFGEQIPVTCAGDKRQKVDTAKALVPVLQASMQEAFDIATLRRIGVM